MIVLVRCAPACEPPGISLLETLAAAALRVGLSWVDICYPRVCLDGLDCAGLRLTLLSHLVGGLRLRLRLI